MFGFFSSIAKSVVATAYSKTSSQGTAKQSSSTAGSAGSSQSSGNAYKKTSVPNSLQKTTGSLVASAVKKAAEGVVVSISEQAKAAAARAGVTGGTVSSTAHKGQHMQADKGLFYKNMVDIGYSPSPSPPKNPPRTSNSPDSEVVYVRQNESHEVSANKQTGQYVHQNGSKIEVISDRDPFKKQVQNAFDNYKDNNGAVKKALASGDKQALNEAVVAMKEAYAEAEKIGNQAARDAAAKMADELRWKGASIGANTTLAQAKTQVVHDAYQKLKTSNATIVSSIQKGTGYALDEGVLESKKLFDRAEKVGDKVGMEAARMMADDLRSRGGTTYQAFTTLQQAVLTDHLRKQNPTHSFADKAKQVASFVADGTPFVGAVKAGIEGTIGTNPITGEQLSPLEKGLSWLGIIPGGKIGKEAIEQAAKKFDNVSDAVIVEKNVVKYEPNASGYYGVPGSGSKVRNLPGNKDTAKDLFTDLSEGYVSEKKRVSNGAEMTIRTMRDGTTITYREVSSSDGTPVVEIHNSRALKEQKIHFVEESVK